MTDSNALPLLPLTFVTTFGTFKRLATQRREKMFCICKLLFALSKAHSRFALQCYFDESDFFFVQNSLHQ